MGPSLVDSGFSSGEILLMIMNGKFPGMPVVQMPLVDVREVAQAHLNGIKLPEAAN